MFRELDGSDSLGTMQPNMHVLFQFSYHPDLTDSNLMQNSIATQIVKYM